MKCRLKGSIVPEKSLAGKVALVTGASRGIGLAIAQRLAALGSDVSLCARDAKRLEAGAAEIRKEGVRVCTIPADLTRAADISTLAQKTEQLLGPPDILINNAGLGRFMPIHDFSEADWDTSLDTNLKAVFLLTKAVVPAMIRRHSGHIVNVASLAGKNAFAGGSAYCASKWGLLGLTYCAAEDLRIHGIRVSAICPGSVATDFSPHGNKDITKMLQPEDVAHAVEMIVTQTPQSFVSEISIADSETLKIHCLTPCLHPYKSARIQSFELKRLEEQPTSGNDAYALQRLRRNRTSAQRVHQFRARFGFNFGAPGGADRVIGTHDRAVRCARSAAPPGGPWASGS